MSTKQSLQYIEIDVPSFVATSPETIETFRFAMEKVDFLPQSIDAMPAITGMTFSPARISLGQNLGERAVLTVTFKDFRHIFASDSFDNGTFFGKWRARYLTRLRNRTLRWYQGEVGQALADMTVRTYIIDNVSGPNQTGEYKIVAKDVLKLADDDRSQAPVLNTGFLVGALTDSATSATLSPTGIGDLEYPASGTVAIAGEEICTFTRVGDVLTLVRGALGTTAVAHEAGDRVQEVLQYSGADPGDVIRDLLVNYANIPSSYINLTDWNDETDSFLQRQYTANIAEPVAVSKLISEIIEQAALSLWWDAEAQQIRLRVLKEIVTSETFDQDNTLEGTLSTDEQPNTRLSQAWTYFGERNPLTPIDEPNNFRSVEVKVDTQAEADFGTPAIKKVFSRWIPFGGRAIAQRVNDIQLARFVDPPRKFKFRVSPFSATVPTLGGGFNLRSWALQDVNGLAVSVPIQITRLNPQPDYFEVEAEEALFSGDPVDLVNRVIILDSAINNVNLRTLHDQIFPDPTGLESPAISVTFIVSNGVIIGSTDPANAAVRSGTWPVGVVPDLKVRGRIQGAGGVGQSPRGNNPSNESPAEDGGTALLAEDTMTLDLSEGVAEIWGGGGGGGVLFISASGGGGAGTVPGQAGNPSEVFPGFEGDPGTADAGGQGGVDTGGALQGPAGDGGDPGQAGTATSGGTAGAAGNAIDGVSNVTITGTGDRRGPEIN